MWQRHGYLCAAVFLGGCFGEVDDHGAWQDDPTPDGGVITQVDASPPADVPPASVYPVLANGANVVSVAAGTEAVFELATVPGEHASVQLTFTGGASDVELVVVRDGDELGSDNDGAGLRTLAVLDQRAAAKFLVKVVAGENVSGTITLVRTAFQDGATCTADCARLIQLPLPNDPMVDGYDVQWAIKRYQFGRRDLIMFTREAAKQRAAAGKQPFLPADFSAWDGRTPGLDVNAPRHVSHQRGKDVDLSLYGKDGKAPWRSYCSTTVTSDGRICQDGTVVTNFDAYENARYFAPFMATGRMTHGFLDGELIEKVKPAATQAKNDGMIPASVLPLYSDGSHLQHWPNHDNHIHVRVSETAYGARDSAPEPFEAP
jgi:hypothetical protein